MTSTREVLRLESTFDVTVTSGGYWVHRFGPTERFAHWWTVSMIAIAVLTGLTMGDDGGSGPVFWIHAGAIALLAVGLVGAVLFGDRRALGRAVRELFVLEERDVRWLLATARHPVRRPPEPQWGMFNAGQKVLSWTLAVSVSALIGTGILAWINDGEGGLHPTFAIITGVLLTAHIFMAAINPATRPALNAMVHGRVPRPWAHKHHGEWLQEQDDRNLRRIV